MLFNEYIAKLIKIEALSDESVSPSEGRIPPLE
jgi:hypothetical protein